MKAHVISLLESPRRSVAIRRAAETGLDIDFYDAVDASSSELVRTLSEASASAFQRRYGRSQTSGEMACLLSHQALYRHLSRNPPSYQLILEDDFVPLVEAGTLEQILLAAPRENADVVILGYAKTDDNMERAINVTNPLMARRQIAGTPQKIGLRCHETTCGALSYLVSPRFLQIMATNDEFGRLADDWAYHKQLGLKVMHVQPLCFREDFTGMASSLEPARAAYSRKKLRLPEFLRPIWRHMLGVARRLQYCAEKTFKTRRITKDEI